MKANRRKDGSVSNPHNNTLTKKEHKRWDRRHWIAFNVIILSVAAGIAVGYAIWHNLAIPQKSFNVKTNDQNLIVGEAKEITLIYSYENWTPTRYEIEDATESPFQFKVKNNYLTLQRKSDSLIAGTYIIQINAIDGKTIISDALTIIVSNPLTKQLFLSTGDTSLREGTTRSIYGSLYTSNFDLDINNLEVLDNGIVTSVFAVTTFTGQHMVKLTHTNLGIYGTKYNLSIRDKTGGVESNMISVSVVRKVTVAADNYLGIKANGSTLNGTFTDAPSLSNQDLVALYMGASTTLLTLDCSKNQLQELDVSQDTSLAELRCNGNQLQELDLSKNTSLGILYCYENQLQELDLSQNASINILGCSENQLQELDLSKNKSLASLDCSDNQLQELDLSQNTSLQGIWCYTNQLQELDVSQITTLVVLYCLDNQLQELKLPVQLVDCFINKNTSLTNIWSKSTSGTTTIQDRDNLPTLIYVHIPTGSTFNFSGYPITFTQVFDNN